MISAREALKIILDSVQPLGMITGSIENLLGKVLAEDTVSSENVPPFDNAGMDGYAVRAQDVQAVPASLTLVGEVGAGSISGFALKKGEAISIMTGAKIPAGADTVVQIEWTEQIDDSSIRILHSVPPSHNIRKCGLDIKKRSMVFQKGSLLRPQEIGVLASIGKRFVQVYRSAEVAMIATGNEVTDIDKPLADGKIRNSNVYALEASLRQLGCEAKNLGIARDEKESLRLKIAEGLKADMLITSGGVSVGKYDLVIGVLKELGVEVKFWKVNIKPGMPLMFGMFEGKPVFGLPGNPVSTLVTFLQFVKPALMKMMGHQAPESGFKLHAMMGEDVKKSGGKRHFVRGIVESRNGSFVVHAAGAQVSNVLTSLTKANCLITLTEDQNDVRAGDMVEVQLL